MSTSYRCVIFGRDRLTIDLFRQTWQSDDVLVLGALTVEDARSQIELQRPDAVIIDCEAGGALAFASDMHENHVNVLVLADNDDLQKTLISSGIPAISKDQPLEELLEVATRQAGIPAKATESPRVLIADDDENVRTMLSGFLINRGYLVATATDGACALKKIERDPSIALALLDVSMPDMGGIELLSEIRKRTYPKVIMITGLADRAIAQRALQLGAFDYILKPFDLGLLESSISASLSRIQYHRQPWWKVFGRHP